MKEEEKSESGSIDAGGAARRAVPTYFSLLVRSLVYHWRMNVAVALGVAAAAAVLTGALLVGDSMRGSLRGLALERLGRVDELLLADRFFRVELADELAAGAEFKQHFNAAVPAIVLTASLENTDATPSRRANRVNLFGCDERFWKLGAGWPERLPQRREIVLNRTVAEQLGAEPGDWIMLRLARPGEIPAESPLGRHDDTVDSHRLKVVDVGTDVGAQKFVEACKSENAAVCAMSALLTTTMPQMAEVVKTLKEAGIKVKTIIGGAPVTQSYADEIGADGYAPDAASAVDITKKLIGAA